MGCHATPPRRQVVAQRAQVALLPRVWRVCPQRLQRARDTLHDICRRLCGSNAVHPIQSPRHRVLLINHARATQQQAHLVRRRRCCTRGRGVWRRLCWLRPCVRRRPCIFSRKPTRTAHTWHAVAPMPRPIDPRLARHLLEASMLPIQRGVHNPPRRAATRVKQPPALSLDRAPGVSRKVPARQRRVRGRHAVAALELPRLLAKRSHALLPVGGGRHSVCEQGMLEEQAHTRACAGFLVQTSRYKVLEQGAKGALQRRWGLLWDEQQCAHGVHVRPGRASSG